MAEALEYSNAIPIKSPQGSSGGSFTAADEKMDNLNGGPPPEDISRSPDQGASSDPAPTGCAPKSDGQRAREKSKYEATEPYRAKKGDRFS
jgi:hypothetical protein